jgi:hypothetical protein
VLWVFGDGGEDLSEWVDGFGWRLGVGIRLDGGIGRFIEVALSGLSSSLEHGGHQMLGQNCRGLSSP